MEQICASYTLMDWAIYNACTESFPEWADWLWYDVISCS